MILLTKLWVTHGKSCGLDPRRSLTRISSMNLSWSEVSLNKRRGSNEIIKAADWKEPKWIIWSSPLPLGRIFLESDRWESLLLFKVFRERDSSAFIGHYKTVSHSSYPESYLFWLIIVSPVAIQLLVGRLLVHFGPLNRRNDHVPCLQMGSHQLPREGKAYI